MDKVSIIIPSRNEKYLKRTLDNIYENATGDFEVLVGFNGPTDYPLIGNYPNLTMIYESQDIGLKPMINKLANLANGKYIYKSDAHCAFGKGFDEILQADMQDDWIVTPRFYVLDKETWKWQDERFYDYFYLCCPFTDPKGLRFKAGGHWPERTKERLPEPDDSVWPDGNFDHIVRPRIDETPQIHGSGWFVNRDYFLNILGGFPETDPFGHAQEPIWLGLKNWLIGGRLMVNKKTWYAHLHQDSKDRGYPEDKAHTERTYNETAKYWLLDTYMGNSFGGMKYRFDDFVDKFMPMPTWPENWRDLYDKWKEENHYGEAIFG